MLLKLSQFHFLSIDTIWIIINKLKYMVNDFVLGELHLDNLLSVISNIADYTNFIPSQFGN